MEELSGIRLFKADEDVRCLIHCAYTSLKKESCSFAFNIIVNIYTVCVMQS